MSPYVIPLRDSPVELHPQFRTRRNEADIIAGRIASARRWQRRRTVLRLRAAVFGRRKAVLRDPRDSHAAAVPQMS